MTDNGLFNLSLNAPNLKPFEIGLCERSGIKEEKKCGLPNLYYAIRSLTNSQYLTRLAQDRRRKKNQKMQTTVSKIFAYSHKNCLRIKTEAVMFGAVSFWFLGQICSQKADICSYLCIRSSYCAVCIRLLYAEISITVCVGTTHTYR